MASRSDIEAELQARVGEDPQETARKLAAYLVASLDREKGISLPRVDPLLRGHEEPLRRVLESQSQAVRVEICRCLSPAIRGVGSIVRQVVIEALPEAAILEELRQSRDDADLHLAASRNAVTRKSAAILRAALQEPQHHVAAHIAQHVITQDRMDHGACWPVLLEAGVNPQDLLDCLVKSGLMRRFTPMRWEASVQGLVRATVDLLPDQVPGLAASLEAHGLRPPIEAIAAMAKPSIVPGLSFAAP